MTVTKVPKGFDTYRNYDWMYQKLVNGKTRKEISELCECPYDTISYWVKKTRIGTLNKKLYQDPVWLQQQVNDGKSLIEIAKICKCCQTTISEWGKKLGIKMFYKCIKCGQLLEITEGIYKTKRCFGCQRKKESQYQKQYYRKIKKSRRGYSMWQLGSFVRTILYSREGIRYRKEYCENNYDKAKENVYRMLILFPLVIQPVIKLFYAMCQYNEKCKLFIKKENQRKEKHRLLKIKREELKQYCKDNEKDYLKEYWRRHFLKRYKTDLKWQLIRKMSTAINTSLKKGSKKGRHWENLVGYTCNRLKKHLEKTMPKNYTWQDFMEGKLHIDHIIPLIVFNFTKPEHPDFKRCWNLKNLQLLPSKENHIKWSKLKKPFQPSLKLIF